MTGVRPPQAVLDHIVRRPVFQRFDCVVFTDGAGEENKRRGGPDPTSQGQSAETAEPGNGKIGENEVESAPVEGVDEFILGVDALDLTIGPLLLERGGDELGVFEVVLQMEETESGRGGGGGVHDASFRSVPRNCERALPGGGSLCTAQNIPTFFTAVTKP